MEDNENKSDINNNDFLLYYTKCPYNLVNTLNNNENNNDSLDLNEDENDNTNNNILNGRWSQKEHFLFIKGCLLYGNYWKKVKKYIQTRSCSQIRSHAQKYLNKLNKKYSENKTNINLDLNFKLSEEEIKRLVNKSKFSDKDMDDAEMYILSIFKGNKEKDKSILLEENDDQDIDNININIKNSKSCSNSTKREKIFNIIKVTKEEKEIERLKLMDNEENNKNNENSEIENILNEFKINNEDIEGKSIEENNNEEINKNSKKHRGKNNEKKILKEDIMLDMTDKNLLHENEIFINKCLDSKDPKDLVKLLTFFGNDINFKVNDVKILNKYQDYLGLDIDNSEDNVDNNSKNKEINEEIYHLAENSTNTKTQNNMYPFIYNPPSNSFQLNPMVINPTFMNHY